MSIEAYGTGGRIRYAAKFTAEDASLQGRHFILLPIPTTKDKKHINGTSVPIYEALSGTEEGDTVVGYGVPREYTELVLSRGGRMLELSEDGEFLEENAYITAVGALGKLLAGGERCPRDTVYGIIGYGRIGRSLLRLLLFLEAKVTVYTTSEKTHISLTESGVESVLLKKDGNTAKKEAPVSHLDGIDILINTAPTDVPSLLGIERLPDGIEAVELASGDNFRDEKVTRLPSLPEIMFPRSAGLAYYKCIKRFIQCEVD